MAKAPGNAIGVFSADPTTGDPSGSFGGGAAVGSIAASTATLAHTAASAANVANLVALNANRLGLIIVNNSAAILYLKYGAVASVTSMTYIVPPGATWEMPANPRYTGRIDGIWSAANGFAEITELTA